MIYIEQFRRYAVFVACILVMLVFLPLGWGGRDWALVLGVIGLVLTLIGLRDLIQRRHAVLRNYPVIGHMRFLLEDIRPEIRQYLIESDSDELPFSREARSLVYQRAKGVEDKKPFGTSEHVYQSGYA